MLAAKTGHLGVRADNNHVLVGGQAFEVDGGGMLSKGLVVGEVVGRRQFPAAITAEEAEIAGMVVEIASVVIEDHTTELLLDSLGRLGEVSCELQQAVVVHLGRCEGLVEEAAGGGHVKPIALLIDVKSPCGEILAVD